MQLLTLREAAAEVNRGVPMLRIAINKGQLAATQPGGRCGRIYITRADLEAFLTRWRRPAFGEEAGAR